MRKTNEIAQYFKKLLFQNFFVPAHSDPHMANGLIVRGGENIKKIGFGVSASLELFQKAKEKSCDAIVVHHSINFPTLISYDRIFQNRIGFLITNNISLFGFHFLLDANREIGNNAQILKRIGAELSEPYFFHNDPWGWIGDFAKPILFSTIVEKIREFGSTRTVVYSYGPTSVRRVIAISGKGAPYSYSMQELIDKKIDLYITGEIHEWNRELCKEAGISLIAAGHYATETLGVMALMKEIEKHFTDIKTVWLDLPNEV